MFVADCVANVLSVIAALVLFIFYTSCSLMPGIMIASQIFGRAAQANFLMPLSFGWSLFGLLFFGPLGA